MLKKAVRIVWESLWAHHPKGCAYTFLTQFSHISHTNVVVPVLWNCVRMVWESCGIVWEQRKNTKITKKLCFYQKFPCSHTILTWFSHNLRWFSHDCVRIVWESCENHVRTKKNHKNHQTTWFFQKFPCSHTILTRFWDNCLFPVLTQFLLGSHTILWDCPCSHTNPHTILTQFSHTALTCFSHTWSKEGIAKVCEGGCEKRVSTNCIIMQQFNNCMVVLSVPILIITHQNHHNSDSWQLFSLGAQRT